MPLRGLLTCPCVQDRTLRLWEYRRGQELHCCHLTSLQEPAGPWSDKVTEFVWVGGAAGCLSGHSGLEKKNVYVGNISLLLVQLELSQLGRNRVFQILGS